jgi:UDP-N-acetylglucosamine transferase subunit ALG13
MQVLVTVGTDHHPFDRLIGWCDRWAGAHPEHHVTIQHGPARAPKIATAHAFLPQGELVDLMDAADVVVCQGGPATIAEINAVGKVPIVVARLAALGEVVDDHQVRFAARLAQDGVVRVATSEDELAALLDRAVEQPAEFRMDGAVDRTARSVRILGDLLDALSA